jgi:hypothetical protein
MAIVWASDLPRRKALRLILGGLLAALANEVGAVTAWAAVANPCLCQGRKYNPQTHCCTSAGLQNKHPIVNLALCPDRVPAAGYTPTSNGCTSSPDSFGSANFLDACNHHDICYGTCASAKATCDTTLLRELQTSCNTAYPGTSTAQRILRSSCLAVANRYYGAVNYFQKYYIAAQTEGCDCCAPENCGGCRGTSCNALAPCDAADCFCFGTVEGGGICGVGSSPCVSLPRCSSTSQCPAGSACSIVTCCSYGVCLVPCATGAALTSLAKNQVGRTKTLTPSGYR